MAENYNRRILLVRAEAAAEGHAELRDVKEIGGSGLAPEALRVASAGDGRGKEFVKSRDAGEGFCVVADVGEEWPGEVVAALVMIGGFKSQQRWRIADRSGVENEPRDHGENGGVGPNSERQGQDDDRGEEGRLSQTAQ